MGDFLSFLSGLNLIFLSYDRLERKRGKVGFGWVRKWSPEAGAILFILGGIAKVI